MSRWRSERGAAAVEFAFVMPILMMLLLGIIEFGTIFNAQISATHAARESARTMSITGNWERAEKAGHNASPSLDQSLVTISRTPEACSAGTTITVTVAYDVQTYTGLVDDMVLTGKAAQRCGG